MPHDTALIATLAAGIGLAFLLGLVATRLRLPPIVGYLLAGFAVGPFTPGIMADMGLAQQLAEIGVILLMFGVGIHFSFADLLAVRRIALPGAFAQIGVATSLGTVLALWWGWSLGAGVVLGLCMSVASTVVLLRALEERREVESVEGRIAVGWLVVQDLAMILVLVLLPALSVPFGGRPNAEAPPGQWLGLSILTTLFEVAAFVALMLVVGRRVVPWLLERVARTGSRELFTLCVLAVALGTAFGASAMFGVSFALGALFAGMVVNGSELSHEAASDSLPLRDAFSVLFFVAVGMLFDPSVLTQRPLEVLAIVVVVVVVKSVAAFFVVLQFGYPLRIALVISAGLAQIGEFSFILAALSMDLGLLSPEGQSLIVAASLISITLNPLVIGAMAPLGEWITARPRLLGALERPPKHLAKLPATPDAAPLRDHVILVGYGRVGSAVGEVLRDGAVRHVVVEEDREVVEAARAKGIPILYGNAARRGVLRQAHVDTAKLLVVATPDPYQARAIVDAARAENQLLQIAARSHSEAGRAYLGRHGVGMVLISEHELALALAHHALLRMGRTDDEADALTNDVRGRIRAVP